LLDLLQICSPIEPLFGARTSDLCAPPPPPHHHQHSLTTADACTHCVLSPDLWLHLCACPGLTILLLLVNTSQPV